MIDLILSKLNFADIGILTGAVLLVVLILHYIDKSRKEWMKFILQLRGCENAKKNNIVLPKKKAD